MNREKQYDSPRGLIHTLITDGLGYCCAWAFFYSFRQTALIALRLGVDPRSIRRWKAKMDSGELRCEGCTKCMKDAVIQRRKLR